MIAHLVISGYEVEGYGDEMCPVTIVRHTSHSYEGVRWAVKWLGNCLGKGGLWAYEPIPSSRDAKFYEKYRFSSVEEAVDALLASTDPHGPKRIKQ